MKCDRIKLIALTSIITLGGCQSFSAESAPNEIKNGVKVNAAIAQEAYNRVADDDPDNDPTPEQLVIFLQNNSKAWNEMETFFFPQVPQD